MHCCVHHAGDMAYRALFEIPNELWTCARTPYYQSGADGIQLPEDYMWIDAIDDPGIVTGQLTRQNRPGMPGVCNKLAALGLEYICMQLTSANECANL